MSKIKKKILYKVTRSKYSIEGINVECYVGTVDDLAFHYREYLLKGSLVDDGKKRVSLHPKSTNELIVSLKNTDYNLGVEGIKYEVSLF